MSGGYVVGFAGRRDGYQVPLALAETGLLQRLVTTFYLTPMAERTFRALLGRVPSAVANRHEPGIPPALVSSCWIAELMEQVGRKIRLPPPSYWRQVNEAISRETAAEANRSKADLLAYEPYAPHAFHRRYSHTPRKVLFHFHVHPELESEIYAEDLRRYPPARPWQSNDAGSHIPDRHERAVRNAWRDADRILCASSFTRRSLMHAGAPAERCRVVPYGVAAPDIPPEEGTGSRFRAIFVGTGIFRKGLHHLLAAWPRAKLPADSELILVCRSLDPQLQAMVGLTPGCRWLPGVPGAELTELYRTATLLVVPSLVEGFGQVYLEALARGCPVLGTVNTCLPDLGGEADGIFLTPVGDSEALSQRLSEIAEQLSVASELRRAAWATARRFPWERFRRSLVEALR